MALNGPMASPRARSPQQIPPTPKEVRVDMSSLATAAAIGRIKAPPMCVDETFKKESWTPERISELRFALPTPTAAPSYHDVDVPEASAVSSSSSTASHSSALSSESWGVAPVHSRPATPSKLVRRQSEQINQKVITRRVSRNGRLGQRWHTDPITQKVMRLVTGCVPILEGGKILFVSASRKSEWILPKGGWEQDEAMEESAIRETFEEAGVMGVLGPVLTGVTHETRKAKKRRLEVEDLQKKAKLARSVYYSSPKSEKAITRIIPLPPSEADAASVATSEIQSDMTVGPDGASVSNRIVAPVSDEVFARIRGISVRQSDETSSIASDCSHSYTHVRMHLFPLYVSDVRSSWPESGRFRKVVDIDEAIQMCESRPEFKAVLMEIKAKNLHILSAEDRNPTEAEATS